MKRQFSKRIFAWLLALCMVLTLAPTSLFSVAAQAATGETHYLAFASDRHGNTSAISNSMGTFPSKVEYVCLDGDMVDSGVYNTSDLQKEVTDSLFKKAAVDIMYGSPHDNSVNDDAGIMNGMTAGSSGLIDTGKNRNGSTAYYVYGIAYNDMSSKDNAAAAVEAFTSWAAKTNPSLPIFIACHMPLHYRRGDNNGAATWLTAINAVAENRDVVYFWGHNHTAESSLDTNVYLVEKGGEITPEDGTSSAKEAGTATEINFTYMNAGYLNAKTSATLVTLTNDTITLDKYVKGEKDTDHSTTFTRTKTVASISVNAKHAATQFKQGDTFSAEGLVVIARYTDGSKKVVTDYTTSGYDMTKAGKQTVTVSYGGKTATYKITVKMQKQKKHCVPKPQPKKQQKRCTVRKF